MRVFVLLETADSDVIGVHTFTDETAARCAAVRIAAENDITLEESQPIGKVPKTLAIAGNISYAVHLIETETK